MNKQELIKRISELPYSEGPIADIVTVNRNWILESIEQLDKTQEDPDPQFVADLIKYAKEKDWDLEDTFQDIAGNDDSSDIYQWYYTNSDNMDKFARAWLDGYTVEKEKRYLVKMKGIDTDFSFLNCHRNENYWIFSSKEKNSLYQTNHTRKELEEAGFGWVFDCPGIEIEEVEE